MVLSNFEVPHWSLGVHVMRPRMRSNLVTPRLGLGLRRKPFGQKLLSSSLRHPKTGSHSRSSTLVLKVALIVWSCRLLVLYLVAWYILVKMGGLPASALQPLPDRFVFRNFLIPFLHTRSTRVVHCCVRFCVVLTGKSIEIHVPGDVCGRRCITISREEHLDVTSPSA